MIRFIITALFLLVFGIVSIPMLLIEWVIGKISPKAQLVSSFRFVQGTCWVVLFLCGALPKVKGKENIPADAPVLYVANHRSIFDIPVTLVLSPGPLCFIAKKELKKIPILYQWFLFMQGEFLDRKDLKQGMQVIRNATQKIENGLPVFVFPEGTRGTAEDESELLEFHEGSFRVAVRSGCPIVPISICNTREIFEAHLPWPKKTHVVVEYGTPIETKGLDRQEQKTLGAKSRGIISETLKKNAVAPR